MVSLGGMARKIFGSSNDRRIKSLRPRAAEITALEPEIGKLTDAELRARTARVQGKARRGRHARQPAGAGLRDGARGRQARARHAAVRRAADRRHGAAFRRHRRDAHRRRQDAGRHAAGLSQCAGRQGRPRRDGQRLPRQARLRMDGPRLLLPRADHRRHRARPVRRRAPRRLCLRRHLRHQQRARLRLSARQYEIRARPDGAARPPLRDRRRGRLDPDRRGAHAADHFRPARGPLRNVQHGRRPDRAIAAGGLRGRREAAHRDLHRAGHREDREHADRGRPSEGRVALRRRERRHGPPRQQRASRRTGCSRGTRTTSSATARSSSSTSSPAA